MNKHFEALAKAIVDIAAAEVVNLVDSKREPIADAARILFLDHGFTPARLRAHTAEGIVGACVAANRNRDVYVGLIKGGMRCIGGGPAFSLWEPIDPNRERTADSARYVFMSSDHKSWQDWLMEMPAKNIRATAAAWQLSDCEEVADAAWTCIDSGDWHAYHFIYNNLSAKRIIESAEAIKDQAAKPVRKLVALLSMEGHGCQGQLIAVEKIPVLNDSGDVSIESEFVKKYAKMHGIEEVTGVSHSFGPGIYY